MEIDVSTLLERAMKHMGCDDKITDRLDPHSPICISLDDLPEMFIAANEGRVSVWSTFDNIGRAAIEMHAFGLVSFLTGCDSDVYICRSPTLSSADDTLTLRAVLDEQVLENEIRFSDALDTFFRDLLEVKAVLHP